MVLGFEWELSAFNASVSSQCPETVIGRLGLRERLARLIRLCVFQSDLVFVRLFDIFIQYLSHIPEYDKSFLR